MVVWLWDIYVECNSNCRESVGGLKKNVTATVVHAREPPVNTSQDKKHKVL